MPQLATVSTSKKPGLRSSQSKKVRMGMSLLRFFAGRVVEIPRMECFGISGLRILPTVAFLYRCTSLYIGRGQVLFQNLLLIIAPSIRGLFTTVPPYTVVNDEFFVPKNSLLISSTPFRGRTEGRVLLSVFHHSRIFEQSNRYYPE